MNLSDLQETVNEIETNVVHCPRCSCLLRIDVSVEDPPAHSAEDEADEVFYCDMCQSVEVDFEGDLCYDCDNDEPEQRGIGMVISDLQE